MPADKTTRLPYLERVYADLHNRRYFWMPLSSHVCIGRRCYPARCKTQKTRLVRIVERRGYYRIPL